MENLSNKELDNVVKLADAATPGPWRVELDGEDDTPMILAGSGHVANIVDINFGRDEEAHDEAETNADFIAAANPDTVRRMALELQRFRTAAEPVAAPRPANVEAELKQIRATYRDAKVIADQLAHWSENAHVHLYASHVGQLLALLDAQSAPATTQKGGEEPEGEPLLIPCKTCEGNGIVSAGADGHGSCKVCGGSGEVVNVPDHD